MDHSYEEIRQAALDILSGREETQYTNNQFVHFRNNVADLLRKREEQRIGQPIQNFSFSVKDGNYFQEVFWDLFLQRIITLGTENNPHESYPFFRLSSFGQQLIENKDLYFFHDVSTYEAVIKQNIPDIDPVTMLYLKEAMQAFMSGCMLSSSVMLGVAAEHSFEKLLEIVTGNPKYEPVFKSVNKERSILPKLNKFKTILDQHIGEFPAEIREDLDTNFSGIIAIIRNFRNESGHPSGKIISREQCYILLQLFIPYCKKIYQLKEFFKKQ
jgi:hypothetical protein